MTLFENLKNSINTKEEIELIGPTTKNWYGLRNKKTGCRAFVNAENKLYALEPCENLNDEIVSLEELPYVSEADNDKILAHVCR